MDTILDAIHQILEGAYDKWLLPVFTDSTYRVGFLRGVFLTVVVGIVGGKLRACILSAWARIMGFFQPTPLPATRPGPSGYNRATGCGQGALTLFLVVIGLIALVAFLAVVIWH